MLRAIILLLLLVSTAAAQTQREISEKDLFDIVESINGSDIGVSEVRADNIVVNQIGTQVQFEHETTNELLRDALKEYDSGEAYELLLDMIRGLDSGTQESVPVSRSIRVFEVEPIYENVDFTVYRTKKTLNSLANSSIIEILPPGIVSNISDLYFPDEKPEVIAREPLALRWNSSTTYYISSLVIGDEGTYVFSTQESDGIEVAETSNKVTGQATGTSGKNFIQREISKLGFDFSNRIIFISLLAGLLLAAGVVAMELEGRKAFEPVKNICRDCEALARVGFKNKDIIDSYIKGCVEKGYHLDDVRISLVRAGWDRKAIRKLLNKYR